MAQNGGEPAALSQALNMLGSLARARGEMNQAEVFFKRSLEAASGLENLAPSCAALEICTRLGDRHITVE